MPEESRSHTIGGTWEFRFRTNEPPPVHVGKEAEQYLVSLLKLREIECQGVRRDLLLLYRSGGRIADALAVAKEQLDRTPSGDTASEVYFFLGQAMERIEDWNSAIRCYQHARDLGTSSRRYGYFIQNNIGFCLNHLNRYPESEGFLRAAIAIDPCRANAFKNLGVCLEGLGRFEDAARTYITGVRVDASDPRTLHHLEDLFHRQPALSTLIPDLEEQIARCREAVAFVAEERQRTAERA